MGSAGLACGNRANYTGFLQTFLKESDGIGGPGSVCRGSTRYSPAGMIDRLRCESS